MPLKSLIHSFCYYFFLSVLPYFTGTRRSIGVILNKWISNFFNSLVNILKDSHTNCLLKSTVLRNHIFNSIRRTKAVAIGFLNANIWILTLINFLEDSLSYYLEKKLLCISFCAWNRWINLNKLLRGIHVTLACFCK